MASVQGTVWNWRDSEGQGKEKSEAATLRRQAVIQALVMGVIGFVLFQWIGHHTFARVIWGLAGLILVLGLIARPPTGRFTGSDSGSEAPSAFC